MDIDSGIEKQVRDAMGFCLLGERAAVEGILEQLRGAGQLSEALRMWLFASTALLDMVHPEGITDAEIRGYAQDIIASDDMGWLTASDMDALAVQVTEIWDCQLRGGAAATEQYVQWMLSAATYFVTGAVPEDADPEDPTLDETDPWWELLDAIWLGYETTSADLFTYVGADGSGR